MIDGCLLPSQGEVYLFFFQAPTALVLLTLPCPPPLGTVPFLFFPCSLLCPYHLSSTLKVLFSFPLLLLAANFLKKNLILTQPPLPQCPCVLQRPITWSPSPATPRSSTLSLLTRQAQWLVPCSPSPLGHFIPVTISSAPKLLVPQASKDPKPPG